ncbi:MAG: hypothetical protein AAF225_09360 [Pseudomonadota bacterium]
MMKKLALPALAALALAACETTSTRPYTPTTANIMKVQQVISDETKVSVGTFAAAEGVETAPTCRLLGAIEVIPGGTPIDYIKGAFEAELFQAGILASDGAPIQGEVTELVFNSFGTGSWTIGLKVTSESLPDGYTVATTQSFKTSYSAVNACQNVVDAFQPAVADLIQQVVSDPQFPALAGE